MAEIDPHLSRINTLWTLVQKANNLQVGAQSQILERYKGPVYRYLLASVRDEHAADELFQEFALRFIQGKFMKASAEKGRFRDYIKTVLFNLIANHHKKKNRQPYQADSLVLASAPAAADDAQADLEFSNNWRDALLAKAWEALENIEKSSGSLYYTMLHFRAQNPALDSAAMAQKLGQMLGKPLNAAAVRQTIHRARDKFADLLLDEVGQSLESNTPEALEEEVIELGLHGYCEEALKRRREK